MEQQYLIQVDYLWSENPDFKELFQDKVTACLPKWKHNDFGGQHRVSPHSCWAFQFRCTNVEICTEDDVRTAVALAKRDDKEFVCLCDTEEGVAFCQNIPPSSTATVEM